MREPAEVRSAIERSEAVICALGMPLMNKEGLRAEGTKNIVRAMEEVGCKRLICLSALGVGDSRSFLPLHYRALIIPLFMGRLFADHEAQEEILRTSDLDWVIARPGSFTKGAKAGMYKHGLKEALGAAKLQFKISPEDVAAFLVLQLMDASYVREWAWLSD